MGTVGRGGGEGGGGGNDADTSIDGRGRQME